MQTLNPAELATILAALRHYQATGQGDPDNRTDAIHEIATDGDAVSLDDAGIDALCEHLNAPPDLEIQRTLVISTAHLTDEDRERFETDDVIGVVRAFEYGWTVHVPDEDAEQDDESMSAEFAACLKLARDNKCVWLTFDRDGEAVAGLPTFEW